MSKTIFKYPVPSSAVDAPAEIEMLKGAEIITTMHQTGKGIVIWAIVDPNETETETRRFYLAQTGRELPECKKYLGTILRIMDQFVLHLFEV